MLAHSNYNKNKIDFIQAIRTYSNPVIMSGLMLDDVKISMQKFGMPDYFVFALMLVICVLIGVYFGFIEKKPAKKSVDEESDYLVGGRQMKVIPITMSLIARYECIQNLFELRNGNVIFKTEKNKHIRIVQKFTNNRNSTADKSISYIISNDSFCPSSFALIERYKMNEWMKKKNKCLLCKLDKLQFNYYCQFKMIWFD